MMPGMFVPTRSTYVAQLDVHSWEKKWQNMIIEMNFGIGIWSPEIMYCRDYKVWDSYMIL